MITSEDAQKNTIRQVASFMVSAARTAPKARGLDNIVACILDGEEKNALARKMLAMGREYASRTFERDAANVRFADAIVLIGTRSKPIGLTVCGLCGFPDCAACAEQKGLCAFNSTDLGIAVGSAVAVAARHYVDNRIMYSAGLAARDLGIPEPGLAIILAVPLSVHGKNPFFDRK